MGTKNRLHQACTDVPSCICNGCKHDVHRGEDISCCSVAKHRAIGCPIRECADYEREGVE